MKNLFLLILNSQFLILNSSAQWVTHHNPVYQGSIPKPSVGTTFTDPHFGTQVTRITDARSLHLPGIIPNYSKRQAWNVGETYLILQTGEGIFRLYNGESPYQFVRVLQGVEGEDVFWHPTDPNKIIYNNGNSLYSYSLISNQSTLVHSFSNYLYANTRGEGNLSNDGRYYAFVGRYTDTTFNTLNVYDFSTNNIISSLNLPANLADFDWVSISPLGNYVVVDYADAVPGRFHGVEVYTRNFSFLWQKPLGAGHSDLGIDANGNEVLVMAYYDGDSNKTFIRRYNLSNGQETTLLSLSPLFDLHISSRSDVQRNFCFISTFDYVGRLTADSASWLPFENEVFALKLDGSGQVARIAHHHSRRFSPITPDPDSSIYWAEPHATVSREGKRILWGSNWEQGMQFDTSCDTYVCNYRSFPPISVRQNSTDANEFSLYQNYPNPFNAVTKIRFDIPVGRIHKSPIQLKIFDVLGREVASLFPPFWEGQDGLQGGTYEVEFDGSNYSSGIYYYFLSSPSAGTGGAFTQTKRMVLTK